MVGYAPYVSSPAARWRGGVALLTATIAAATDNANNHLVSWNGATLTDALGSVLAPVDDGGGPNPIHPRAV